MKTGAGAAADALMPESNAAVEAGATSPLMLPRVASAGWSSRGLARGVAGVGVVLRWSASRQQQALALAQQHDSVCEPRHSAATALGESASSHPAKVSAINFRTSLS